MTERTERLKKILYNHDAGLVGIGDMSSIPDCEFKIGIAVAVPLPKKVIMDLKNAPTVEYYHLYYDLNKKLNEIITAGEEYLTGIGFEAYAQTTDRVKVSEDNRSRLPHKTVAVQAGLGWIGKNNLLVTPQYGSAVRIFSLLTNAPLECDEAVDESHCGACRLCVENCPTQALQGTLWKAGMEREELVDVEKCYKKQVEIMSEATGIETDLCGKCFAVCAYTQKYLSADGHRFSERGIFDGKNI